MEQYDYVLVKKEGNDAVDVQEWEISIIESIKSIIPTACNIVVVKDGYSFENATPLTNGNLRSIGKKIASSCPDLFELAGRTYFYGTNKAKRSGQLFEKKKRVAN